MTVLVVDYGMGNLGSVHRSFEECGARVLVSDQPADIRHCASLVLPGVGAFSRAMAVLVERGWHEALRAAVLQDGIPMLGICLGMQLLADKGYEGGETAGLGLVPGEVVRMEPRVPAERIPHVGWNEVYPEPGARLFEGIPAGADFYFVHSYTLAPRDPHHVAGRTPYCGGIASAVSAGSVHGVQFHPEKSSRAGFRLISNFLGQ
jgi:glutamine amidotransferase